jgi:hypothetical protein
VAEAQTPAQRLRYFAAHGPRQAATLLVPHLATPGQDDSWFESRECEMVRVPVADLEVVLALLGEPL